MEMQANSHLGGRVLGGIRRHLAAIGAIALIVLQTAMPGNASAEQLRPATLDAFDRYVQLSESEISSADANNAAFLWIDRLPASRRAEFAPKLARGEVLIESLESLSNRKTISVPHGMIHDWIGTVFIPGATLRQTLAFEENYDQHEAIFQPDVVRSKILSHQGDDFVIYYRLRKQKIITSILDTDHSVHYHVVDATHAISGSHTTRIQEVENAGTPSEKLRPVGDDDGFLWRMQTYWRFQEKDGGTYVECRSISLTRDIPEGLGWLVGPFVKSIPQESLTFTLGKTRSALLQQSGARS
jgi:hypothetical protein